MPRKTNAIYIWYYILLETKIHHNITALEVDAMFCKKNTWISEEQYITANVPQRRNFQNLFFLMVLTYNPFMYNVEKWPNKL